ncbi:MAG: TlpA family protein disulfide reductase [Thermoflavifilum aggregans]|nr:TlpA family protein disulfide reductase [Thermoflavifilum aggregans]
MMKKWFLFFVVICMGKWATAQQIPQITSAQLKSYTEKKDGIYVINLWATWCRPCVEELPDIEKVAASLQDKPVHVILVSLDYADAYPKTIQRFVTQHHLQSPVYWLNETNPNAINEVLGGQWMGVVPTTLVVNAKTGYRRLFQGKITSDELTRAIHLAMK